MKGEIEYLNPDGLMKSAAFSQVITTRGNGKTIHIGGQNALNAKAELVGKGDLALQTEQALKNVETALKACSASFDHIIRLTIYLVKGQDVVVGYQSSRKFFDGLKNKPVITVLIIEGLGRPDYLLEIEATAFVPDPE